MTFGEISTQRQQLELHVDELEYRLHAKISGDRGGRKTSEDSRAGEHREKLTQVCMQCIYAKTIAEAYQKVSPQIKVSWHLAP